MCGVHDQALLLLLLSSYVYSFVYYYIYYTVTYKIFEYIYRPTMLSIYVITARYMQIMSLLVN